MAGIVPRRQRRVLLGSAIALALVAALARGSAFVGCASLSGRPSVNVPSGHSRLLVQRAAQAQVIDTVSVAEGARQAADAARAQLLMELDMLAKEVGVEASNRTRTDLELNRLMDLKVAMREEASDTLAAAFRAKTSDLERRMVRAELAALDEGSSSEVTTFELARIAFNKVDELKQVSKASADRVIELEASLLASQSRATMLMNELKEIGTHLGVGGLGGLFQFFMSEEDLIKEVKAKSVTAAAKLQRLER